MNKDERKNKAVMGNHQLQQVDEDSDDEQFPAGINVLAVDDDETCLMWLDHLLHECQYKVTTTLHAREALQMLRQNKGKYDIVITDVQMPDIDGFQLLETIAIEMDIPVIMMSMYNDHEYVERGVLHGAVDYLLKPVRQEEIQNIWQHVLRRRQAKAKAKGKEVANRDATGSQGGIANGVVVDSNVSAGETNNRKRRDLSDEDYEEENGSGRDNDEQTSQKRPRVVWTPELHRKFVTAVNQLGMDKAVPKKILDMMDVEGLSRENIASHLQKYRMYLKRIGNGNQQQMMGVMAGRDSLEAMNYRSPKLPNSLLTGYPPSISGILSAKQNPASVNFPSLSSSDLIQSGQNLRNSIAPNARTQPNGTIFPNGSLFQGGFNPGLGATRFGVPANTMDPKMVNFDGNGNSAMMKSGPFQFLQNRPSSGPGAFKFGGTNAGFLGHSANPGSWNSVAQHPMNGTFPRNPPPMNNNGINPSAQQLLQNNGRQRWDQGFVFGALNPFLKSNGNGMVMDSDVSMSMDQTHLGANNVGDFMGQALNTNQTMNQQNVTNNRFIVPEQAPLESMEDIMNSMIGGREEGGGGAPPSAMFDGEFSFEDYSPGAGL